MDERPGVAAGRREGDDDVRDSGTDVRPRISVCIVCRNEADRLGPCLDSVSGWADEVIVMDLASTDGSADVARSRGAIVLEHEPVPVVEWVRNDVAAIASGDWVLAMDPDERVTPGLAQELQRLSMRPEIDMVVIPFCHHDFGHAPSSPLLRFDPKPRMYRPDRVVWPTVPNALPTVAPDRTHRMPSRDDLVMIHDRNRSVEEALDRVVRYAPAQARSMLDSGQQFTARMMFSTLAQKSLRQYYWSRAARDGVPGIMRATTLVAFHFYVWASFWQQAGAPRTPQDDAFIRRVGLLVDVVGRGALVAIAAAHRLRRVRGRLLRR
jgi:glycosyltransferase involved in cell wall biosynthesis